MFNYPLTQPKQLIYYWVCSIRGWHNKNGSFIQSKPTRFELVK